MIKKELRKILERTIKKIKIKEKIDFQIFVPSLEEHGDYSTNLAFSLSKVNKKSPSENALILIEFLETDKDFSKIFEKVEEKNGFLNFFLNEEYLKKALFLLLKHKGNFWKKKKKKIQVEFISANPTGPLTVGNARGGPFGDTLANVLKLLGFKVQKEYYVNDYGKQILELGKSVLGKGKEYKGDYIEKLRNKIKEKDPYKAGEKAAKIIVDKYIKPAVNLLGIKYDKWFFESELYKSGLVDKLIKYFRQQNLIYEKEGAVWLKTSKFGDSEDRVIIKKDGFKTYLMGDIAYHYHKFRIRKFDKVINIWGADHLDDVKRLKSAMKIFGWDKKLEIILLQFVTLYRKEKKVKMSKRKGEYVALEDLVREIGKDATRFFFLLKSADTHLNFDIELAKEKSEKNPVYYVQYAYARICSILRMSNVKCQMSNLSIKKLKPLGHPSEIKLIKTLLRFPEIVEEIGKNYQVHRLAEYALSLAGDFHRFYQDCKVLSEDLQLTYARLTLLYATRIVLEHLFRLMGISAPQKM